MRRWVDGSRGRALGLVALAGVGLSGCPFGSDAHFNDMVPGERNGVAGVFDCWLSFQLDGYPDEADPRDLAVVFTSAALKQDLEFGWDFVAAADVERKANAGWGWVPIRDTTPEAEPPLGREINVRFPLALREHLLPDGKIWLEATLWWGGPPQDTIKPSLELYKRRGAGS